MVVLWSLERRASGLTLWKTLSQELEFLWAAAHAHARDEAYAHSMDATKSEDPRRAFFSEERQGKP